MMNFPADLAAALAQERSHDAFLLRLDLAGYDTSDKETVDAALRAAMKAYKAPSCIGRFVSLMLSQAEIGDRMGIPKSTISALSRGCIPERFTPAQRDALRKLVIHTQRTCADILDDLG